MQRGAHPLAAFADGLVGQPDDREERIAGDDLDLNVDRNRLDSAKRDRRDVTDHAHAPAACVACRPLKNKT